MFPLLHGIVNSQRKAPFEFLFTRETTNDILSSPFLPGEPVAKGGWTYGYLATYVSDGKLYFEINATGDTSSVVEVGIVSSTSPNPTYADSPQIGSFGDGILHLVPSEERYFRSYAQMSGGEYYYSNSPGIQFPMYEINLTYFNSSGGGFMHTPFTINVTYEILGLGSGVEPSTAGVILNLGGFVYDEMLTDPYWYEINPALGINVGADAAPVIGTVISQQFSNVGGFEDTYGYIRAYYVINGVKYWSGLIAISV